MEYQKLSNLLNDETNRPFKFKTRNWVTYMMMYVVHTLSINKLNLKHQC